MIPTKSNHIRLLYGSYSSLLLSPLSLYAAAAVHTLPGMGTMPTKSFARKILSASSNPPSLSSDPTTLVGCISFHFLCHSHHGTLHIAWNDNGESFHNCFSTQPASCLRLLCRNASLIASTTSAHFAFNTSAIMSLLVPLPPHHCCLWVLQSHLIANQSTNCVVFGQIIQLSIIHEKLELWKQFVP